VAETVTIEGQKFLRRNPLGVLGLSLITIGIYFFYWYYQVNDELRRFEHDDTISPTRSLMAILFGWLIIVPPFIALYNTATHVQTIERRRSIQPQLEPALVIVILLLVAVGNGVYLQEHLNRIWTSAASSPPPPSGPAALPPMPGPPT
jgi:mannose/fructose/N-acetylgalactosamine-specific phosphotransferase system component IIC